MTKAFRSTALLAVASLSSVLVTMPARADPASTSFDHYVQDLRQRMQSVNADTYQADTMVDQGSFRRYVGAVGQSVTGGPAMTDTAIAAAQFNAQPLHTFNGYLAYLGQRMRVDAGPSGPLLKSDSGMESFDQYIEEINYRIQTMMKADDLGY